MQINQELVVTLRNRKSWSQEELAVAAGLNAMADGGQGSGSLVGPQQGSGGRMAAL